MSWAVGFDIRWSRDIGYGVPSICDHPDCNEEIDRGLGYVCGNDVYGGEDGCGLFFCDKHHDCEQKCERCAQEKKPFKPTPDTQEWRVWKLTDKSWQQWRDDNPVEVEGLRAAISS